MTMDPDSKALLKVNSKLILEKTYDELGKSMRHISMIDIFSDPEFTDLNGGPLIPPHFPMNQLLIEEYLHLILTTIPVYYANAQWLDDKLKYLRFYKLIFTLPIHYKSSLVSNDVRVSSESMCYYNKASNLNEFLGISVANNPETESQTEQLLFKKCMDLSKIEEEIDGKLLDYPIDSTFTLIFEALNSIYTNSIHSRLTVSNFPNKIYKKAFLFNGVVKTVVKFFHHMFMSRTDEVIKVEDEKEGIVMIPKIPRGKANENQVDENLHVSTFADVQIGSLSYDSNIFSPIGIIELVRYIDLNKLLTESELLKELILQMCACNLTSCMLTDSQDYVSIKIPKNLNPKLLSNWNPLEIVPNKRLKNLSLHINLNILLLKADGSFYQLDGSNNTLKRTFKLTTEKTTPTMFLLSELYENYKNTASNAKDKRLPDFLKKLSIDNMKATRWH